MNEISLFSLLNLALKHLVLLILTAVVFAMAAFGYCKYVVVPRYSATGSMLVTNGAIVTISDLTDISNYNDINNKKKSKLENTDIVTSLNFIPTAEDMLKQSKIFKLLADKLDNQYSYEALSGMASIRRRGDESLYVDVTFTAASKDEAVKLVNAYMEISPDYVKDQISTVALYCNYADKAYKVYPRTTMTVLVSAMFGALAVYAILLIIFLMNNTVVNEDDFKERFDVSVIGSIPDFSSSRGSSKYNNKYNKYYGYYNYNYYGRSKINGK